MKVHFDFPLSNTSKWKGLLNVTAEVDGHDAEIDQVIHEDPKGNKTDITYLVDEWCSDLYETLVDVAVQHEAGVRELVESDYTMQNQ